MFYLKILVLHGINSSSVECIEFSTIKVYTTMIYKTKTCFAIIADNKVR